MWNTQSQWTGDYTAAGVTGIDLFANVSSGTSPVDMRLAFGMAGRFGVRRVSGSPVGGLSHLIFERFLCGPAPPLAASRRNR